MMNTNQKLQHDDEWLQTDESRSDENLDALVVLSWFLFVLFHRPVVLGIAQLFE